MTLREDTREQLRASLRGAVVDSTAFYASVSPILSDGRHTAHGILAQLVFWHERHVEVARALADGYEPDLMTGTVEALNAAARHRYARESMASLAQTLTSLQNELDDLLVRIPNWSANFPVKRDSGFCNVEERIRLLDENIRNRLNLMKRAARQ